MSVIGTREEDIGTREEDIFYIAFIIKRLDPYTLGSTMRDVNFVFGLYNLTK